MFICWTKLQKSNEKRSDFRSCVSSGIEEIMAFLNKGESLGFHNKHFIRDYATLRSMDAPVIDTNVAYCFSSADKVLGTKGNGRHLGDLKRMIDQRFSSARDYSCLVAGLNHCLNKKPGDYVPFCKNELGKHRKGLVQAISQFYRS